MVERKAGTLKKRKWNGGRGETSKNGAKGVNEIQLLKGYRYATAGRYSWSVQLAGLVKK